MKVKICGIKRIRDALFTAKSGADAIGCIVNISRSPRNVDIDQARELKEQFLHKNDELNPAFIEFKWTATPEIL